MEFRQEAIHMNVEIANIPDRAGTFADCSDNIKPGNTSESDSKKTEYVDVLVHDGSIYRRKFARKKFTVQKYSCNGMTDVGFSRLEAIEDLVEIDRAENGNQSYNYMKDVVIEKAMLGNRLKKDAEKSRKRLRMK